MLLADHQPADFDFKCFKCAATIATNANVITYGDPDPDGGDDPNQVLWISGVPDTVKKFKAPIFNSVKHAFLTPLCCSACGHGSGKPSVFGASYDDVPSHVTLGDGSRISGKCCKLIVRKHAKWIPTAGRLQPSGRVEYGVAPFVAMSSVAEPGAEVAAPGSTTANCENCDDGAVKTAAFRCMDCETDLCRTCWKQTHAAKMFKGHTVLRIAAARQDTPPGYPTAPKGPSKSRVYRGGRCFNCQVDGHPAKDCPEKKASFSAPRNATREQVHFDRSMKCADPVLNPDTALQFVRAIQSHVDPSEVIWRIMHMPKEFGIKRLREVVSADSSRSYFASTSIPLFEFLSSPGVQRDLYKEDVNSILEKLYTTPGYIDNIQRANITAGMTGAALSLTCWFILSLAKSCSDARSDPAIHTIAGALQQSGCEHGDKLMIVLQLNTNPEDTVSRTAAIARPGGKHDNDFADFRRIQLIPTVGEVMADVSTEYLPLENKANRFISNDQSHLLDSQFRLLRADLVRPLREKLAEVSKSAPEAQLHNVRFVNACVSFKKRAHVLVNFKTPKKIAALSLKKRVQFWSESKLLTMNSLICFEQDRRPVLFGRVSWRDEDTLAEERNIGVMFEGDSLLTALSWINTKERASMRMIEVSQSFFSYEPMLRRLQGMDAVPFAEEFVSGKATSRPIDHMEPLVRQQLDLALKNISPPLDRNQQLAVQSALNNQVTLIQGPPGTGKTYIGVLVATLLLKCDPNAKILCVCYKNHALDQFLEALHSALEKDNATVSIVRIGGQSKNELVQQFQLRELSEQTQFDRDQKRQWYLMKTELEQLEIEFKKHLGFMSMQRILWSALCDHLRNVGELNALEQLATPVPGDDGGDFTQVGPDGKEIRGNYLWERWRRGSDSGPIFHRDGAMWQMKETERNALETKWLLEMKREQAEGMKIIMQKHQDIKEMQFKMRRAGELTVMRNARVIGCTTHGAASRKDLLAEAGAKVLIVEEAAEILEAHVLTSIGSSVEHIIMIGDHKQLRPKAECHDLSVEKGLGYGLNRSLFERLVETGFAYNSLAMQHRMMPALSELIRTFTYPELKDAPSVLDHPPIKGVQMPIVFINHDHPENAEETALALETHGKSKVNEHEASVVTNAVRYLLQQGYSPGQLVVLTPYLGQVRVLTQKLANVCTVLIGDLDMDDMANAGLSTINLTDTAGSPGAASVRISTIDNYQGEEADVVVASLVRSNQKRILGHLQERQRVNVLLSRARNGLILVGNAQMLLKCRTRPSQMDWNKLMTILHKKGAVHDGLPIFCQQHPAVKHLCAKASDFSKFAPDGGCTSPCDAILNCGHRCSRSCHAYDPDHARSIRCRIIVADKCSSSHPISRECWKLAANVVCVACEVEAQTCIERERVAEAKIKEAEQKAAGTARRLADEEIARLRRDEFTGLRRRWLKSTGEDALEYNQVKDKAMDSAVHSFGIEVEKIEKIEHATLERKWYEAKKEMINPVAQPRDLFHGTSTEVTELIAKNGFNLPAWKDTNMYGQGVYFATNSTKSANELYTSGSGRLILCKVLVGRSCDVPGLAQNERFPLSKHVEKSTKGRPFLDVDLQKMHASRFDSVYGRRGGRERNGVVYDEMIVYDARLALPTHIIHFKTGKPPKRRMPMRSMEILPSRNYDAGSEEDMAFRIAESQFLRMLSRSGMSGRHTITKVEYHHNGRLRDAFDRKRAEYDTQYGPGRHETRLGFHGTKPELFKPILENGFDVSKVGTTTDPGWWGAGIYFSENTATSINYARGVGKLLLSQVLMGRPYAIPPDTPAHQVRNSHRSQLHSATHSYACLVCWQCC